MDNRPVYENLRNLGFPIVPPTPETILNPDNSSRSNTPNIRLNSKNSTITSDNLNRTPIVLPSINNTIIPQEYPRSIINPNRTGIIRQKDEDISNLTPSFLMSQKNNSVVSDDYNNIIKKLQEKYLSLSAIFYHDSKASYLLMETQLGTNFFIKIDQPNIIPNQDQRSKFRVSSNGSFTIVKNNDSIIDNGSKSICLKCIKNNINGIMLLCNDNMCYITKRCTGTDETYDINDENFIINDRNFNKIPIVLDGGDGLKYPVYSLSFVMNNPNILSFIEKDTRELHNESFIKINKQSDNLKLLLTKLDKRLKNIDTLSKISNDNVNKVIDKLLQALNKGGNKDKIIPYITELKNLQNKALNDISSILNDLSCLHIKYDNHSSIDDSLNKLISALDEKKIDTLLK